mmetsp:Transcript_23273/g.36285  ORF Transcript_23273/g.36285 Transcript_23273/m.36285 type:complete len:120 (+) Transcript_23273:804-1163(+)
MAGNCCVTDTTNSNDVKAAQKKPPFVNFKYSFVLSRKAPQRIAPTIPEITRTTPIRPDTKSLYPFPPASTPIKENNAVATPYPGAIVPSSVGFEQLQYQQKTVVNCRLNNNNQKHKYIK